MSMWSISVNNETDTWIIFFTQQDPWKDAELRKMYAREMQNQYHKEYAQQLARIVANPPQHYAVSTYLISTNIKADYGT